MRKLVIPSSKNYRVWQIGILVILFLIWHIISRDDQLAFFFGEPLGVFQVIWKWLNYRRQYLSTFGREFK
ncbi:hypothetical protein OURE66S_02020 [Oligella ureolytica]